jgi:uncharacterized membrane protein required for colicin V production
MSRVFATIFAFVVAFLLVYNILQLCPAVAKDPNLAIAVKVVVILFTVALVKLIFNRGEQPKSTHDAEHTAT